MPPLSQQEIQEIEKIEAAYQRASAGASLIDAKSFSKDQNGVVHFQNGMMSREAFEGLGGDFAELPTFHYEEGK